MHKENVRVYRNVQASFIDEAGKKAREINTRMDQIEGTVKKIDMFYTTIYTPDGTNVVVPNQQMTNNSMINCTVHGLRFLSDSVGISYDADLDRAKAVVQSVTSEERRLKEQPEYGQTGSVFVRSLAESSVIIGYTGWVDPADYYLVRHSLCEEIKKAFDAEGIEIPYNQLDIHLSRESGDWPGPIDNGV